MQVIGTALIASQLRIEYNIPISERPLESTSRASSNTRDLLVDYQITVLYLDTCKYLVLWVHVHVQTLFVLTCTELVPIRILVTEGKLPFLLKKFVIHPEETLVTNKTSCIILLVQRFWSSKMENSVVLYWSMKFKAQPMTTEKFWDLYQQHKQDREQISSYSDNNKIKVFLWYIARFILALCNLHHPQISYCIYQNESK